MRPVVIVPVDCNAVVVTVTILLGIAVLNFVAMFTIALFGGFHHESTDCGYGYTIPQVQAVSPTSSDVCPEQQKQVVEPR